MRRIRFLVVCLLLAFVPARATPFGVVPTDTDARITGPNDAHYCWTPTGEPRGMLLLYLPGTGNKPRPAFPFADVAAELGYHVIFLDYPDALGAQVARARSPDLQAHLRFRLAIIQGGQATPRQSIDPSDAIENRLDKLLVYLSAHHPDQHWDQFLDPHGQPAWEKLAVAGGSQGGGHAYVLGKIHKVARVLMFSSPKDYNVRFNRPPSGFDDHTRTPLSRFFAFNHLRDDGNGCTHLQQAQTLEQMKLTALGVADVDKQHLPYDHARVLYTGANVDNPHHSTLFARFREVWRYMLSEPVE